MNIECAMGRRFQQRHLNYIDTAILATLENVFLVFCFDGHKANQRFFDCKDINKGWGGLKNRVLGLRFWRYLGKMSGFTRFFTRFFAKNSCCLPDFS